MISLNPWLPFYSTNRVISVQKWEHINCLRRYHGLLCAPHLDFLQKDALTLCMLWSLLEESQSGHTENITALPLVIATHHFKIIYSVGAQHCCESPSVQPEKGWLSCAAWREHNCLFIYLQGLIPSLYPLLVR